MKRSDFYIRLTTAVLFVAVASYIGVYLYNAAQNTFVTAPAIRYTIEETSPAVGYIVRVETVVPGDAATVLPVIQNGMRAARGQAVAVEYLNHEALHAASELRELRLRVEQLEAIAAGNDRGSTSRESVLELSRAVQNGGLHALDTLAFRIEAHVFENAAAPDEDIASLRAQLERAEGRTAGVRTIYAPVSGVFTQVVDGFENIGPSDLHDITPSQLEELFAQPNGDSGAGKLVTGIRWYFAAVMDADAAARLTERQRITVQFTGAYQMAVEMIVESVGRREGDQRVVRFSSNRGIHDVAQFRFLRAEIVFGAVSGIRVPKEAIHLYEQEDRDGKISVNTFVYIQTGVRAERVRVEILHEAGGSYIVRDGVETGGPLRSGSTIIVKANNLFHNQVVA